MFKKKLLVVCCMLVLVSCSTYEAQYLEPELVAVYPSEKKVEKTFYLVGDAGKSPMGGMSDALTTLQKLIDVQGSTPGDYTIFLGDNIYPDGMPPKDGGAERKYAENHIDGQLKALNNFKGETVFIPGNHDWYNDGLNGLNREAEYLKKVTGKDLMKPSGGCPLESIEVSEDIQLIIIDSQWYLEDWNSNPNFNEFCEIKSREKFFIEIEVELQKHQNKTILFTMHHPMFTNGTHGGYYALQKHLYPLQKKIPMPGLASLVAQIRSQGGVSVQDRYNELYNKLMIRLADLTKKYSDRLVFASGHEHTMHHIEDDGLVQIQTGNGAKASYATIGTTGEFSYGGQGFAVMKVFNDGSSWVQYFSVGENYTPNLLFEKELFPPTKRFDVSKLASTSSFSETATKPVYTQDSISEAVFFKTIWGAKYKNAFTTPVNAKVANLDSIFGGVSAVRESGLGEYQSLELEDTKGRLFRMRALKKNALEYKQEITSASQQDPQSTVDNSESDSDAETGLPNTLNESFYTAAHPFVQLAIPPLADAIDVFNTKPRLFYVPKQKGLGDFNEKYGDDLYYISVLPNEDSQGQRVFEYPNDIETTDDILFKLRQRGDIQVDEENYIKSRLFDMLIGDWDRESDHWNWAEYYNRDSLNVFVPIPKNRDDAFSSFEGNILDVAKSIFGSSGQQHLYEADLTDFKFFNTEGLILDRAILQRSGKQQWLDLANEIQEKITDSIVDLSFKRIPEEVQDETLAEIVINLKARKANLAKIAENYYEYLATLQTIDASDFNDYFEITRFPNGETNVKLYTNYKKESDKAVLDRTFSRTETKELWIYGLNGKDTFELKGDTGNKKPIFLRLIGGQSEDTYRLIHGKTAKVYDHESKVNTIETREDGTIRFTDVYNLNTYDYRKQVKRKDAFSGAGGYNPDDGIKTGVQYTHLLNGFQRNPFSQKYTARANYFFGTESFEVEATGEIANIQNDKNLSFGAYFSSPNYTVNYFGYGNETKNLEEEGGIEANRVEVQTIMARAGLVRNSNFGSFFQLQGKFEAITVNSPLPAAPNPNTIAKFDETTIFGTLEAIYNYRSFDDVSNPKRGMMFDLNLGVTDNLENLDRVFGYLKTRLGFYNSLTKNEKLVLKTNIRAAFNFENKFEFYQGIKLGANTGLRGYREERFTGKSSLVGSADIRYSFDEFRIELVPIRMGVYAGADIGKLWIPSQTSSRWHNDFGGGIWMLGSGGLNGTFSAFHSAEGTRYTAGLGLSF